VTSLVAIDIGTSAIKAIAFTPAGERVAWAELPTPSGYGPQGEASFDAEAVWAGVCDVVREVTERAGQVDGVGVCAQLALLIVDAQGQPTTAVLPWSDTRATQEAQELAAVLDADAVRAAGRRITAETSAAKLRWLAAHERDAVGRARWVLSLKDFVVQRLTGAAVADPTHASYTALFDIWALEWSPRLAEAAGIDLGVLPRVHHGDEAAGMITRQAAEATGLRAGTFVAVGGPDGTVGAIGAGAVSTGVTVDVAGSTDVLFRTVDRPLDGAGRLIVNAFPIEGLWAAGGATGLTGGAVSWLAEVFGYTSAGQMYHALGADLDRVPPGSEGLVFWTALTGERFPSWEENAVGGSAGLRLGHGRSHLVRAALEGAAFLVGEGIEAIRRETGPLDRVVVVGGTAARPSTLQLRADAWQLPVATVVEREASALGAAMLAGVAGRTFGSIGQAASSMVRPGVLYEPRPEAASALRAAYLRWREARPTAGVTRGVA
jgi:xylulokinase